MKPLISHLFLKALDAASARKQWERWGIEGKKSPSHLPIHPSSLDFFPVLHAHAQRLKCELDSFWIINEAPPPLLSSSEGTWSRAWHLLCGPSLRSPLWLGDLPAIMSCPTVPFLYSALWGNMPTRQLLQTLPNWKGAVKEIKNEKKNEKKKKRNWLYPVEFTSTVTSSISCCSWLANWRTGGALGAAFFEAFGPVAAPPLPAVWGAFPFVPGAVSTPIVCDVSSVIGSLFHFNSLHLFTTTTRTDVSEFQEQVIRRRDWVLLRTEDCCLFAYFLRFIWVILFRFFLFLSEIFFLFQVKWRCLLWSDSHSWRWKTLNCLMHQCTTPTRARQRADVGTDVVVSAIVSLGYAIHTFGVGVSIWYRRRLSSSSIFFFFFSVVALVGRSRAKTRVRSLCWPAGPLGIFALISRLSDGWNRAQLG